MKEQFQVISLELVAEAHRIMYGYSPFISASGIPLLPSALVYRCGIRHFYVFAGHYNYPLLCILCRFYPFFASIKQSPACCQPAGVCLLSSRNYAVAFAFFASWDFRRAALFLWIRPLPAALSTLTTAVLITAASAPSARALLDNCLKCSLGSLVSLSSLLGDENSLLCRLDIRHLFSPP